MVTGGPILYQIGTVFHRGIYIRIRFDGDIGLGIAADGDDI